MPGTSPTVQRRRLGAALRALREARGLTGSQAGAEIERSAAWISRVEAGLIGLRGPELRQLLAAYTVASEQERGRLLALAESGRQPGWWGKYRDSLPESYLTFIGLEAGTSSMKEYDSEVIPGLLQTADYARQLISSGISRLSDQAIRDRVEVRIRRQQLLTAEPPLRFTAVIWEPVLRRLVGGPAVMRRQLEHLAAASERPNIEVRFTPTEDFTPIAVPSFVIMTLTPDLPEVVYVEDQVGGKFEDDTRVPNYRELFERISSNATAAPQAAEVIDRVLKKLPTERDR